MMSHKDEGKGTHAAFHEATTIATPAAFGHLPFNLTSLSWPFGTCVLFYYCCCCY